MYMGHYAIALGARRWLQPLPLGWLLFASIEPDMHDVIGNVIPTLSIGPDTHTILGVTASALVIAMVTAVVFRRLTLALGAGLLVLSHVGADYLTSRLPAWRDGPKLGLHLYAHPLADFLLEAALIASCLFLYGTCSDLRRPVRYGLLAMGALMLGAQAIFNFGLGSR